MESYLDLFWNKETKTYDIDHCNYENPTEAIVEGIFSFCGCGYPISVLYALKEEMEIIKSEDIDKLKRSDSIIDEGHRHIIWYLLDSRNFTEHGGCVPGWLTDRGEGLLNDITKEIQRYEEEK